MYVSFPSTAPTFPCFTSDLSDLYMHAAKLHYVYRKPRYRPNTVLYFSCLFGIAFIFVSHTAGNSIDFALRVLQATSPEKTPKDFDPIVVRAVAFATAFFACFVHAVSRKGGIWLSNLFAAVKVGILLLIIFTSVAVADKAIKDSDGKPIPNYITDNTGKDVAFQDAFSEPNGYARAFLAIGISADHAFTPNGRDTNTLGNPSICIRRI
jgi:amino acid transporter